jgi:Zn-finger nucleic acid-binding protein
MKCPIDSSTLVMSNREGIEIDYCPECRGVWLDRGELDKIVERSAPTLASQPAPAYGYDDRGGHDRDKRSGHGDDRSSHGGQKKRGRESWIGDLFG